MQDGHSVPRSPEEAPKRPGTERRRAAILAAARSLLDGTPLSMRQIAAAAGVSPATPYNLFGTKRRIFLALYHHVNERLRGRAMASPSRDALDRVYHAIRLVAEDLAAEPVFFRALFAVVYASGREEDAAPVADPAVLLWRDLMEALLEEGLIAADVDVAAFTRNFVYLLSGATMDWADGRIDTGTLETAVRYGFTLAALAVAKDAARARLEAVLTGA